MVIDLYLFVYITCANYILLKDVFRLLLTSSVTTVSAAWLLTRNALLETRLVESERVANIWVDPNCLKRGMYTRPFFLFAFSNAGEVARWQAIACR